MKFRSVALVGLVAAALGVTGCGPNAGQSSGGSAQGYPEKNLEMLVGYPAGSYNDVVARKFAESLSEELGQRVMVVNREGSGGALAAAEAAKAPADGYNLLFAPTGAFTSTLLYQDVSYEIEDFRSIKVAAESAFLIVVPSDSPYETFEDLTEAEGRVTYSALGEGNQTHIIGEGITQEFGLDGELVAYPGGPPAMQAVINGDVDFGIQDQASALPRIEAGEVQVLAISDEQIPEALEEVSPGVRSISEFGLADVMSSGSQALAVPKDVSGDVVAVLEEAANEAVNDEEYLEFLSNNGAIIPDNPKLDGEAWFREFMPAERDRFKRLYDQFDISYE